MIIKDNEFKTLAIYLKDNYGINLHQKKNLIEGRLSYYVESLGYDSFSEYLDFAFCNDNEISNIVNKLTTNHTFFMREESHFDYLTKVALPEVTKLAKNRDIRLWSAGCSSGEEPYTIAMHLQDYFKNEKLFWDTKILATDISAKVLDIAKKGIYTLESLDVLPTEWKKKYFKKVDANLYQINNQVREEVIFRSFNLMESIFPFKKQFHIIFCRNVMIYFDNITKDVLIKKFYDMTEPGGYLFIGHSETINRDITGYKYIMPAVYRKI